MPATTPTPEGLYLLIISLLKVRAYGIAMQSFKGHVAKAENSDQSSGYVTLSSVYTVSHLLHFKSLDMDEICMKARLQ
jgi:hypothetical protein